MCTDRRHADKAMASNRHAFVGFHSRYTITPRSVVLAGISLAHPSQPRQRICRFNCSHRYFLPLPTYPALDRFRRPPPTDRRTPDPPPLPAATTH
jgi:hypothetical protein